MSIMPEWMREQFEGMQISAELAADRVALHAERLAALPPCDLPEHADWEPHIHIQVKP